MAQTPEQQRYLHPLPVYNFRVDVAGISIRCAKVTGLQREYRTLTYRHGLSFREGEQIAKYFVDQYTPLTLEQGTVIGSRFLHEWLETTQERLLAIHLCDESGSPAVTWRVRKALPVRLVAPEFDAKSNDVVIDTLELMAAGISIEHQ